MSRGTLSLAGAAVLESRAQDEDGKLMCSCGCGEEVDIDSLLDELTSVEMDYECMPDPGCRPKTGCSPDTCMPGKCMPGQYCGPNRCIPIS